MKKKLQYVEEAGELVWVPLSEVFVKHYKTPNSDTPLHKYMSQMGVGFNHTSDGKSALKMRVLYSDKEVIICDNHKDDVCFYRRSSEIIEAVIDTTYWERGDVISIGKDDLYFIVDKDLSDTYEEAKYTLQGIEEIPFHEDSNEKDHYQSEAERSGSFRVSGTGECGTLYRGNVY